MKQFLVAVFIICYFSPVNSYAQFLDGYSVSVIGNRSNIVAEKFKDFRNYKTGLGIGFHIQKALSKRFTIHSGLEFSSIRYELDAYQEVRDESGKPTGEMFGDRTTSSLFILSVPLMVEINGPANFFGFLGPRLDFELGSNNGIINLEYRGIQISQEDRLSDYSEFFVPGWSAGLGKRFSFCGLKPSISFRFSGDFLNLIRDDGFMEIRKRRFEILVEIPLFRDKYWPAH